RLSNSDLGIWDDAHIPGLTRIVEGITANGSVAAIQLAHGGRKGRNTGENVAPSPLTYDDTYPIPKELTELEIEGVITQWGQAAKRAEKAGFQIAEIHAAHGYLIHQFLSPLSNKRSDRYKYNENGDNAFLFSVIEEVKKHFSGTIWLRISATDYHPDGMDVSKYLYVVRKANQLGVSLIDVSTGALVPATFPVFPGYQVDYAHTIKTSCAIPSGAVGLITSGLQAEAILQAKQADMIFIGREFLRNPFWPRTAALELGEKHYEPKQYARGW
ncbi:MAG: NADPH dehydrogenase, partial [Bacilli bacterium]